MRAVHGILSALARGPAVLSTRLGGVVAALGLGLILALALGFPFRGGEGAGPVRAWVADRRSGHVLGVDGSGRRIVEVEVPRVVRLSACRDRGVWVVGGTPQRLRRLDGRGRERVVLPLAEVPVALATLPDDSLLGLGPEGRLWRTDSRGAPRRIASRPGVEWMCVSGWRVLLGGEAAPCSLWELEGGATFLEVGPLGLRHAAAGARRGEGDDTAGWWTLESGGRLVVRRDARLRSLESYAISGGEARYLVGGATRLWAVGGPGVRLWSPGPWRLRTERARGAGKPLELSSTPQTQAVAAGPGGELWLALAGALVGGSAPDRLWSQGGFDELVDLAPVPR